MNHNKMYAVVMSIEKLAHLFKIYEDVKFYYRPDFRNNRFEVYLILKNIEVEFNDDLSISSGYIIKFYIYPNNLVEIGDSSELYYKGYINLDKILKNNYSNIQSYLITLLDSKGYKSELKWMTLLYSTDECEELYKFKYTLTYMLKNFVSEVKSDVLGNIQRYLTNCIDETYIRFDEDKNFKVDLPDNEYCVFKLINRDTIQIIYNEYKFDLVRVNNESLQ